jgi:hypothetical protein
VRGVAVRCRGGARLRSATCDTWSSSTSTAR